LSRNSSRPAWADRIIQAHAEVAGAANVTHAARLPSSARYFCWQEDGVNTFFAGNRRDEEAVKGYTDLFTSIEYDPWAEALGEAFDKFAIAWEFTGTTYEANTGMWHHTWEWEA
jgi:hypothetical protein